MWWDLDFPEVIDIKRRLYPPNERYAQIGSSVTNWSWMDAVDARPPLLVIAEGLLMYLSEADVRELILRLRDRFHDVTFIFDAFSTLTAKQAGRHPSVKGANAAILWGVDSIRAVESYGVGIEHVGTLYLTDERAVRRLPTLYRAAFRAAGLFPAARDAHRVFIMRLNAG